MDALDTHEQAQDNLAPSLMADEEDDGFFTPGRLRNQYMDYITSKVDEINEQKESRHYYHGSHWTSDQLKTLRRRHQPPITWNRINRKINGIIGIAERMRSDPKAEPTTPASEAGADIATHVIRYILDANEWKAVETWCLLQGAIDGIFGVQMVLISGDKGDPDIALPWVIGDEFFYDPKSYRLDFADARYMGIAKWVDIDEAKELFPDMGDDIDLLVQGDSDITTGSEREYKWVISSTRRVRLVEHWYKSQGKWRWAFYVADTMLAQGVSPFVDAKGQSMCSFIMSAVGVDQDGDRYGFVRNLRGPQDALNQSKSKALHSANSRRIIVEEGAVDDIETTRREWARPDGVIIKKKGFEVAPDNNMPDIEAQVKFSQEASNELDSYANINLAAMQGGQITQISGRAVELLRQPGMAELGPFILAVRGWKLRIYRALWSAAQRFWTAERWIRVTSNDGLKQFLSLNQLTVDEFGRPSLVNALGAVDVNISFEEGRDVASVMDDVFDMMRGFPPGTFPPMALIEMAPLPATEKAKLKAALTPKPNPMQQQAAGLKLQGEAAKNAKTAAEAQRALAQAEKERAAVGTEQARAAHLASEARIAPMEFLRDTIHQAADLAREQQQAPQQAAQPMQYDMGQQAVNNGF